MGATTDGEEMNSGSTEPERIKPTVETCEFEENNMSLPQDADCETGIQDQKPADGILPVCNMPQRPTSNSLNTDKKEAEEQHGNALSASSQRSLPDTMGDKSEPIQGTLELLRTDTPVDLEKSVARPTPAEIMELLDKKGEDWDAMYEALQKEMQLSGFDMTKQDLLNIPDVDLLDEEGYTPLYKAALKGHLESVEDLISQRANADKPSKGGLTPLHAAAQKGHEDIVDYLILQGADVNVECKRGRTPLHTAAEKGHTNIMERFFSEGTDVSKKDNTGWTPFHAAVQNGRLEAVKYLIAKGAKQNKFDGMTSLYIAAQSGHLEIVKVLISQGADVNEENDSGQVPLHAAASRGHLDVISFLLDHGADVNKAALSGWTPFHAAVSNGHLKVVKYLRNNGAQDTRVHGMTPLYIAAQSGHLDIVKFLFSQRADVNEENESGQVPLHGAASRGHLEVMRFLVHHGADVNKETKSGWTAFHAAISNGSLDVAKYLQTRGACMTGFDGMTPLYIAARAGHLDVVKFLISEGHNMNELNSSGLAPIHGAVMKGHSEVIEYLIRQGADISTGGSTDEECNQTAGSNSQPEVVKNVYTKGIKNKEKTLLYIAVECGRLDLVEKWVKEGAHVNGTNSNGEVPLHAAARNGNLDITKYLIRQGANLEKKDDVGTTPFLVAIHSGHLEVVKYLKAKGTQDSTVHGMNPLFIAAQSGHLNIVKFLVSQGADVNEENDSGQVPLHGAATGGHLEIVKYLANHGAHVNKETVTGSTPFFRAVSNGHLELLKYLRSMGACMTRCHGMTPLYIAAQNGHSEVVKFIIKEGGDVNDGILSGRTALHAASFTGNLDIVNSLVREGGNVNAKDGDDWTPLHAAAQEGHTDVVTYLISNGADINATDAEGMTPRLPPSNPGYSHSQEHANSLGDGTVNTDSQRTIRNGICQDHVDCSRNSISVGSKVTKSDEYQLSGSRMKFQLSPALHLENIACKHSQDKPSNVDLAEIVTSHEPAKGLEEEMNTIFTHNSTSPETEEMMKGDHGGRSPFAKARLKYPVKKAETSLSLETENSFHEELDIKHDTAGTQHGPHDWQDHLVNLSFLHTTKINEHQDDTTQSGKYRDDEDCTKSSKAVGCEAVLGDENWYTVANIPQRKTYTCATTPPKTKQRMKGKGSHSANEKPKYPFSKAQTSLSLENKSFSHERIDTQHDNAALLQGPYKWQLNQIKGTFLHVSEKTAHHDVGRSGAGKRSEENREIKMPDLIKCGSNTRQPLGDYSTRYTSHSRRRTEPFLDRNCTEDSTPVNVTIYAGSSQNEKKNRRRTGVQWSPLLVLLPSFIHMAVVMAIILSGSPVLVAGGLSTEQVILQAGQPALIPFDIPRQLNNISQIFPHFTLRFESKIRPFCINGEDDIEGFKTPSQFPRFSTSVAEMASSFCVKVNIDPVDVVDEDMYVLRAFYHNFEMIKQEIVMKEILVHKPPGPAKCFITISENDNYPYEVHCQATTGSTETTLTCYQYGQHGQKVRLVGDVSNNGQVMRGVFLLPHNSYFSCCSRDVNFSVDEKMCNDFEWPPKKHSVSSTIVSDPNLTSSVINTVGLMGNTEQEPKTLVESQVDSSTCKPYMASSVSLTIGLMIYLVLC